MLTQLEYNLLKFVYENGLSHLSSCLSCINIIDNIYKNKKEEEPFLLGNGHAGSALFIVLQKYYDFDPKDILNECGIHPVRNLKYKIWESGGSLGQPETVAIGYALSNRNRKTYLITSDGGAAEGSVWEALRFKIDNKLDNLEWHFNNNGQTCLDLVNKQDLIDRLEPFVKRSNNTIFIHDTNIDKFPFLKPIESHYYKIKDIDWEWTKQQKII